MKLHLPVRLRKAVIAILATLAPSATSVGSCALVGTSAAIGLLGMQAYAGWSAQYADTYLYTGETTIDLTSSTVLQGYYCLRPGGVASCSGEVELLKAGNGVEVKLRDDWPAGNNNNFTTGFVIKELRFAEGAGANTLTVQDGQSATVEKVTGSPVDINFHEAGELILAGTAGTVHALRNINFLDKDRNNVFNRNLTISEGVTVQVSHLDNSWGMGVLRVNGTLNVTDLDRGFYMSSGANNSTENNVITGTGTVNTQTLICQNAGTYNFSVNALNVEGTATLQANVNIMDGTLAFNGATTMNSTVALYDGAILQNNAEEAIRFGENFRLNIENLTEQVADDGSRVYTILGGSGNKDLSSLSTSQLLAHYSNGWDWSFNQNGTIVATRLGRDVSYAGGTLSWSTAADNKSFTQGSAAVSFEQGDNVTFAGDSQVTLAEDIQATRVIVGSEAEVAVHTAGHALAADFVEVEGALRYQLGGENSSILDLKGAGTLVLDNADADSAASFSIGGDVSAFTGGLTVQGNTTLALHGKANGLFSASEASITIGDGAVLKVENTAGWHTIWRLNDAQNLHTTGTGTIDVVDRGWLTEDVHIHKNFSCETSFALHGDGFYSNKRRNVYVGEGAGFYVDDTLTLITYVALVVQGGTIDAGTLAVGNDQYWSKFFMSSGLLTAGSIKLSSHNGGTEVNISGGCVEFTQSQALNRAGNSAPYVRIVGSGPDSTVTLKATRTDWTLDGAGLNNKPVIGNITVDAGNTHGITLANVALTGSIVNNAGLTLGEGISVAAGSSAVLSGASIAVDRTITNAGTLSLQTGSVSVSRENLQRLEISTEGATIAYSLDGKNFVTDGSENGFRHLTNARYYLAAGGNLSVAQGLQAQVGENSYNIFADATGLGFIVPETSRSDVFVVNSGNVTVGAEAQAIAESYEINGGTMVLNAGSVAGESVHFNSASSALHIGGESSITGALVLNQGSVTVSGGHVNTLNVAGGSATLNGGSADTLLVGGSNGSVEVTGAFSTTSLRLSENGSAMLTVKDGGNLTITGTNNAHSTNSSFMLGHWPYSSTLRQEGGEVNAREAIMYTSWDGTGSYQALGGVANLKGIHFWAHNGGAFAGSFLLGDETTGSARVNFGSFGIVDINSSVLVKLGNGTLGATADWGMTYNGGYAAAAVQLVGTTTGTIFNTEDAFAPGTGHIININPVLTGNGKLVKEGIGSLYLKGANTYSGGTVIQGGELVTSQASSLGSGAVYLKDGSLTLNADLSISSLDYSGGNLNANGYNLTITDSLTVRKQLIINGSQNGAFPLNGLKTLSFINSTADSLGGAIYGDASSTITLSNNSSVEFTGNTASYYGGAIYGRGSITIDNNGSVGFSENSAGYGGAVYGGGSSSTITLSNNVSVEFTGNTASSYGGAIYGDSSSTITLSNNSSVEFTGNTASSYGGGAIYGYGSITIDNNGSVTFSGNTSSSDGGAIYGGNSTLNLSNNGSVCFIGNTASVHYSYGGAISVRGNDIECINNKSVVFTSNKAATSGGAVYVQNGSLVLSNNEEVEFCCNEAFSAASYSNTGGGAIHGDNSALNLSNNGSVVFRENMTSHLGGAIRIDGDLYIQNNDSVLFERNLQKYRGEYCLRGIYAAGGSGKTVSLSAAEGGSIEFHEGIYVGAGSTVNLNADYGETQQMGDIVFTGAFAATHLNDMISALEPGRVATQEEIRTSCTTEVLALTNLYGGCLRVEDGAVYKGKGITVHEGSGAVVRVQNADLDHDSDLLTFNSGTSLELAGNNNIIGNVQLLSGSSLLLDSSAERGETTIAGRLQFSDACSFTLNAGGSAYGKNELLMSVSVSVSGWSDVQQILPEGMTLTWVDNLLILNYDAASFNRFINGSASFDSQQIGHLNFLHYENLDFAGINGSAGGGALQGNMVVSHNGRVSFLGNAAPRGGAIKGENIMLGQNESLIFSKNIATGGTGGALHGQSIVINGNQKALFEKNAEIAADGYRLRGIWAANELELTAGENDEIRLHDSSYAGQTVEININTENRPAGLVVLDGSHVAEHLAEVKGTPASEKEILLSRVHEWKAATLHAGTLQVSGGARLLADSFTVGAGSALVLDGGLLCAGTLNLEPNAILHLKDESFVLANFAPAEDTAEKTISLHDLAAGASIRMEGDMDFSGVTFLIADENLADGTYRLLELEHTSTVAWNPSRVTVTGVDADKASLVWNDGCLYLNYGATPGVQEQVEYDQDGRILVQRDTYVCAAAQLQDSALCGSRNFLLQNHVEVSGSGLDLLAGFAREYSFGSADAENRSSLTFSNIKGNAIRLDKDADFISLKGLKDILFEANVFSADEYVGGAIRGADNCTILIEDNNDVSFISNSSPYSGDGGAISLGSDSELKLRGNRSVSFINNYLPSGAYGGAIMGNVRCDIVISDNDGVLFSENSLCSTYFAGGGAIALFSDSSLSLHKNKSVIFSKNAVFSSSAWEGILIGGGGAIDVSGTLSITENANILFSENVVSSPNVGEHEALEGAAISCYGDLNIRNNGSVLFEKNVEVNQEGYRLRSIHANGSDAVISLSAAAGKSIEFRDSVYIWSSEGNVKLNADYTDTEGTVHKQTGDILFTGATTEADLYAAKGNVAGTEEEIRLSRTSEVKAMTNLYGGRLRVEDGAVYQGYGITVHEGSEATVLVKDATLSHTGYDLIFNAGTTLHAAGVSSITGNVVMLQGSQLVLTVGAVNGESAVLTLGTAMDSQGVNLLVEGAEYLLSGEYKLIYNAGYDAADWMSVSGCAAESLVCKNGMLTLTCSNAGNKAVENGSVVGNTTGNMVVANGADVTIAGAIAADAETGAAGYLIINNGHAELVAGGCMDGHVVFANAGSGATRELTVATDASVDAVVLSGSADGTVAVETGHEFAAGTLEGKGSLVKTGGGTMTHDGEDSTVQGRVEIREGRFENTGNLVASQIEVSGGHLENQGTISHVELNAGKLSGGGVFCGLTMKGGVLVIGNSPGFQQYTDDLVAEGGELVFSVSGLENAATAESESWVSETYSQIDMGGYELSLGDDTTLTIALGGSLLENLEGEFNMQLFDNVGNIEDFTHGMLTLMLENTRFVVTTEAEGLCGDWEAGADLSLWVHGVQYRVVDSGIVLSGRFGAIPEPTTTTLSLLALAALCARRRRK